MALARIDRRSRIVGASVQTTLLGGLLNCFLCFLIVGFHPYPAWPERVVVGIERAPAPDWLDDATPFPEVVVRVDRWFLRVQEPEDLAQTLALSDRTGVRSALRFLSPRARALTLIPEDDATTQTLVQVTDDATASGWYTVNIRLEQ